MILNNQIKNKAVVKEYGDGWSYTLNNINTFSSFSQTSKRIISSLTFGFCSYSGYYIQATDFSIFPNASSNSTTITNFGNITIDLKKFPSDIRNLFGELLSEGKFQNWGYYISSESNSTGTEGLSQYVPLTSNILTLQSATYSGSSKKSLNVTLSDFSNFYLLDFGVYRQIMTWYVPS